ncbi:hypothetical protein K438DRAFT_1770217 [Mycena galopus ATCC 62051]|nr:hypothetical protein K438DRAFT_1770217 [Mycena galopus ATCC 62051]
MITLLTAAAVQSEDIPTRAVILVTYQEPTGQCGHPRIEINPSFLAYGLDLHGPTGLAPVAGVPSRTIHCRALDYGFVKPAAPVDTETLDPTLGEMVPTCLHITMANMVSFMLMTTIVLLLSWCCFLKKSLHTTSVVFHGTENVRVTEWMEEMYGPEHSAHIWGQMGPNIRVEYA